VPFRHLLDQDIVFVIVMTLQTDLVGPVQPICVASKRKVINSSLLLPSVQKIFPYSGGKKSFRKFGSSAALITTHIAWYPKKGTRPGFPRITWEVPPDSYDVLPDYSYIFVQRSVGTFWESGNKLTSFGNKTHDLFPFLVRSGYKSSCWDRILARRSKSEKLESRCKCVSSGATP